MREAFERELDRIESVLVSQGVSALQALEIAVNGLNARVGKADDVVALDAQVDSAGREIEASVETLLARQSPVAADLRRTLALFRTSQHLRRVGRNASRIVQRETEGVAFPDRMEDMGALAASMLTLALDAFSRREAALVDELRRMDERLDRDHRIALEEIVTASDVDSATLVSTILIARSLERVGDHAVAIGEECAYLVAGRRTR